MHFSKPLLLSSPLQKHPPTCPHSPCRHLVMPPPLHSVNSHVQENPTHPFTAQNSPTPSFAAFDDPMPLLALRNIRKLSPSDLAVASSSVIGKIGELSAAIFAKATREKKGSAVAVMTKFVKMYSENVKHQRCKGRWWRW